MHWNPTGLQVIPITRPMSGFFGRNPSRQPHVTYRSGVCFLAIARSSVDVGMQNRVVPITLPHAQHGAFLCAISGVGDCSVGTRVNFKLG